MEKKESDEEKRVIERESYLCGLQNNEVAHLAGSWGHGLAQAYEDGTLFENEANLHERAYQQFQIRFFCQRPSPARRNSLH